MRPPNIGDWFEKKVASGSIRPPEDSPPLHLFSTRLLTGEVHSSAKLLGLFSSASLDSMEFKDPVTLEMHKVQLATMV